MSDTRARDYSCLSRDLLVHALLRSYWMSVVPRDLASARASERQCELPYQADTWHELHVSLSVSVPPLIASSVNQAISCLATFLLGAHQFVCYKFIVGALLSPLTRCLLVTQIIFQLPLNLITTTLILIRITMILIRTSMICHCAEYLTVILPA